ncbi:MAG: hypothetical protein F7C81_02380 [Desulfurococcales archaeon]|nr:hypothetical protein [Desulfurococcales archaeon]
MVLPSLPEGVLRDVLIVLFLASLPSIAWYFIMRRAMIRRQVAIIRGLEDLFKPKDKRYWLIGYLVGFQAKYWIRRGPLDKVLITYTTPPYHAFFYLPVVALARRREKLEVVMELNKPFRLSGPVHIYTDKIYSVKAAVERDMPRRQEPGRVVRELVVDGRRLKAYYHENSDLELALDITRSISKTGEALRVSIDPGKRRFMAVIYPRDVNGIIEAASIMSRYIDKVIRGDTG